MPMQRAKRLLEGLRVHHLGFGFFWTVTFIVLSSFPGTDGGPDLWRTYVLAEQTVLPFAVGALGALCALRQRELPYWTASAASFMLSGAALLYFLMFSFAQGDAALAFVAGLLMGASCALFFLLWELFYVSEGQQRALICIPLSAAMSVALYLLISRLPLTAIVFIAVALLPFLALFSLQKSLQEIEMDFVSPFTRATLSKSIKDLWRPVLCVGILGFSWKLMAGLGGSGSEAGSLPVLIAFATAALLVVALELFLSKGFDILHIYQLLFPVLTIVFLLPSLLGDQYTALLNTFLMFGFETVNLLLIITCAVYSVRNGLPSSPLYALAIAPVLFAMSAGSITSMALGPALSNDFAHNANLVLLCIALLSVALILITRSKQRVPASVTDAELLDAASLNPSKPSQKPSHTEAMAEASADAPDTTEDARHLRIRTYLDKHGLSPRETEVAELLMKGHSVSAISNKLFISENTTRGHAKSIYKKLDVHSRQELVDLGDQLSE